MGLAVLGLQQSSTWGWGDPATWGTIVVGLILLVVFVKVELRTKYPLIQMRIFEIRAFFVDNAVLFLISIAFVPMFLFASEYAQISLGYGSSERRASTCSPSSRGFATAAQFGGRILDQRGARPSVVAGCVISAVGYFLWARQLPDLDFNNQWYWVVVAGAGMGLVLGPASTDAVNRAPKTSYGEVTGITQTVRNFGGQLRARAARDDPDRAEQVAPRVLAVDGSASRREGRLDRRRAQRLGRRLAVRQRSASTPARAAQKVFEQVQHDFALSCRTVFYGMAVAMALAFVVALVAMPAGRVTQVFDRPDDARPDQLPGPPGDREGTGMTESATERGEPTASRWTRSSSATASTGEQGRRYELFERMRSECPVHWSRRSPTTPTRTASGR